MKTLKVFGWIIFIISLIWSSFLLIFYLNETIGWEPIIFAIIPITISIIGIGYFLYKVMPKHNNLIKLIIIILAIIFIVCIWPTPYKYINVDNYLFKINRITSKTSRWRGGEWHNY